MNSAMVKHQVATGGIPMLQKKAHEKELCGLSIDGFDKLSNMLRHAEVQQDWRVATAVRAVLSELAEECRLSDTLDRMFRKATRIASAKACRH
jgi:hypothetical protein